MSEELPLKPKYLHPMVKKVKATTNNSGVTGGKKHRVTNGIAAVARQEAQKESRQQTKDNMMVMHMLPNGKIRFVRKSEMK